MLSETQLKAISLLFRSGIIIENEFNDEFIECLINMHNKCVPNPKDDRQTYIFKTFIACGGTTRTVAETHNNITQKELSDTLFFAEANDIELTLLAKAIYLHGGTKYNDFLKWQIDVILRDGKINIKNEYIKWRSHLNDTDEQIQESMKNFF